MNKTRYFLHFKGGVYKILTTAKDSETLENLVVYKALYGKNDIWVRPERMFFEKIIRNGIEIERFKEITEEEYYAHLKRRKEISKE